MKGHSEGVTSLYAIPYSSKIVSGSSDKTIKIWDYEVAHTKTLIAYDYQPKSIIWEDDNNYLIVFRNHILSSKNPN